MNLEHLRAMLWLRWTLLLRGVRRGSVVGTVFTVLVGIGAALLGTAGFALSWFVGRRVLPETEPDQVLLIWSLLLLIFFFMWTISVLTELQRGEPFSAAKLLHLPVSPSAAFALNYLSSLLSLALVLFVPCMLGLACASVATWGLGQGVLFVLIGGFVAMVSAVVFQFRGWLASVFADRRRRGRIVALLTASFVLVANLPNFLRLTSDDSEISINRAYKAEIVAVEGRAMEEDWPPTELETEKQRLEAEHEAELDAYEERQFKGFVRLARRAGLIFPGGWLAIGAWGASRGVFWQSWLAALGMVSIAALSLRRSYLSTLRMYRGAESPRRSWVASRKPKPTRRKPESRLAWIRLRGVPEASSATAAATIISLRRSPQVKLVLMTPVVLLVVLGGTFLQGRTAELPDEALALTALGMVALVMLSLAQLVQNQFGLDGGGFRVFVLSPTPRWQILLGKNLALAPITLGLGWLAIGGLAALTGFRASLVVASFLQSVMVFLICCMLGNWISILGPVALSPGSLKAQGSQGGALVKQAAFALLIPIAILPTALPLGLEAFFTYRGSTSVFPVYLLLSAIELPLVVYVYRRVLASQGDLLSDREQRVLQVVAVRPE